VYAYIPTEQINRELKTDLGLGAHQVRGEEGRIEKSFGIAVLAYLLLLCACHQEILHFELCRDSKAILLDIFMRFLLSWPQGHADVVLDQPLRGQRYGSVHQYRVRVRRH